MSEPSSSASYPWIETRPGRYCQRLDSISQYMALLLHLDNSTGRHHSLSITSYCNISCPSLSPAELETRLRKAWVALRYYNPAIASDLVPEPGCEAHYRSYETPTRAELSRWVWQTFRVHTHKSVDVLCNEVGDDFMPVLNFCPGRHHDATTGSGGELLLVCHHFFGDGRGTFYLWDAFLKLVQSAEEVVFGDEAKYLPPACDHVLGLPARPACEAFVKAANTLSSALTPNHIALPLATSTGASEHRAVLLRRTLTEQQTAAILLACRERAITVTAACRAAYMMSCKAAWDASAQEPRDQYVATEVFDARPWFRKPYDSRRNLGVCNFVAILTRQDLSGPKSFDQLVMDVDKKLKDTRQEYAADPTGLDAHHVILESFMSGLGDGLFPPLLSSYGLVDGNLMEKRYGDDIYVHDVWTAVLYSRFQFNVCWIWTFHGLLNIMFVYTPAIHSTAMMNGLVQDMVQRLLEGLGIE